jgi:hypothetical protein
MSSLKRTYALVSGVVEADGETRVKKPKRIEVVVVGSQDDGLQMRIDSDNPSLVNGEEGVIAAVVHRQLKKPKRLKAVVIVSQDDVFDDEKFSTDLKTKEEFEEKEIKKK